MGTGVRDIPDLIIERFPKELREEVARQAGFEGVEVRDFLLRAIKRDVRRSKREYPNPEEIYE